MDIASRSHLLDQVLAATTRSAVVAVDTNGCIELLSAGAEELLGLSADEAVGAALVEVAGNPAGANHVGVSHQRSGRPVGTWATGELCFHNCDGSARVVPVSVTERRTAGDQREGWLLVADLVNGGSGGADVRTQSDFMASVSHELRTPITSILGYTQLLQSRAIEEAAGEDVKGSAAYQLLARIERNALRLKGLVEDVLTMSQVEEGAFRFELQPIDLREPVRNAMEQVSPLLPLRELSLQANVDGKELPVSGDAAKLERAFSNLLANAVKFSEVGDRIRVEITTKGSEAVVAVTDHGVGISPADQDLLFDRFFRGSTAQQMVAQGAGLGLTVTKAIVTGHGGRIEVESAPGQGSTFTVRLPLIGPTGD